MKKYLTELNDDLTENLVEEPESLYGFTYADYVTWNFKERIELIRGKIFKMSPAPTLLHQTISVNIEKKISRFLDGHSCKMFHAPIDVKLAGRPFRKKKIMDNEVFTVVQPDIIVVCDEDKLKDARSVDGAPELVIEILSPGNTRVETKYKFDLYEENGVLEYWVVYPEFRHVYVYVLNKDNKYGRPAIYEVNENTCSSVLEGLSIPVNEIFKL